MASWPMLSTEITAVGALGTAAFGLVDSFKALPGGGISRFGFGFIRQAIEKLTPPDPVQDAGGLSQAAVLHTLMSQWINGVAADDQLSIAKSQIKLRLNTVTAAALAKETGVDPLVLGQVAANIATGTALSLQQSDVYGRFDLMLTTLLDQAYQRADQRYRNAAKFAAIPVSVALALVGAHVLPPHTVTYGQAVVLGLIATPIAPIAKDLSSAVQTGAQALQTLKG